jgi:hypothetical protein
MDSPLPIKSVLVTGPGGCRMDFVAGWLGTLPGFIDNEWKIDPITGRSSGDMLHTKILDSVIDDGVTFEYFLESQFNLTLSTDTNMVYASTCHGYRLNQQLSTCDKNLVKVIQIVPSEKYYDKIKWEFIAKTFLSLPEKITIFKKETPLPIDRLLSSLQLELTNKNRIDQILFRANNIGVEKVNYDFDFLPVPYEMLLCKDGSKYITDTLNISVHDRYHEFWNAMLPMINTPDEIYRYGYLWKKPDII